MSEAARSRIGRLVRRYSLPPVAEVQLAALLEVLSGDPRAATTVRDEQKVLDDHLADSLVALELAQVRDANRIADLGSGAGLPGLPLAIARPAASVALVESNGRKCAFLERAAATCGLENVQVVHARAEEWRDGLGRCDLVTARALAPLDVVAEYAAPLLKVGGTLVVWRGARDPGAEAAGAVAAAELGLEPAGPLLVRPYARARNRHLHVMSKLRVTPAAFPRRPGIARKRPLGGRGG
jgi:16S rRNA (guanine527-N7)-methyltransferase